MISKRGIPVTNERWQPYRAGFLNFWEFLDDTFYFRNGKLMLHGHNASGKSVASSCIVPMLLDGNRKPERLDAFSTKSRKLDEFMLGEPDEEFKQSERTGYIFLEYRRKGSSQYLTTGMGIKAKRGGKLDTWYFIITDNRRIGKCLSLYHPITVEGEIQKVPLTKQELERLIDHGGEVFEQARAYAQKVNQYLFKFPTMEGFEELIKLLIQLRSPKLSKDFKPTVTYEILNQSIPILTDEELRPLSETIETMDHLYQRTEQLQREVESLGRLCAVYDRYNTYVLAEKAEQLIRIWKNRKQTRRECEDMTRQILEEARLQKENEEKLVSLDEESKRLKETHRSLSNQEVFSKLEEKQELIHRSNENEEQREQRQKNLEEKQAKERELQKDVDARQLLIHHSQRDLQDFLLGLGGLAEEGSFTGHASWLTSFEKEMNGAYSFDSWKQETHQHHQHLDAGIEMLQKQEKVTEYIQGIQDELGQQALKIEKQEQMTQQIKHLFQQQKEDSLQQFFRWKDAQPNLRLQSEETQSIVRSIQHLYEQYELQDIQNILHEAYERNQIAQLEEKSSLDFQLSVLQDQMKQKEWEREKRKKRQPEPVRIDETETARVHLQQRGIPFVPFYLAVDFLPHVSPELQARIEDALTQMGILDALIVPARYQKETWTYQAVLKGNAKVKGATLADYLTPSIPEGIPLGDSDVEMILRSISVGQDHETAIFQDGSYRIGLLHGHAPSFDHAFLGKERREMYRLRLIEKIESDIRNLEQEAAALAREKQRVEQTIHHLKDARDSFPYPFNIKRTFMDLQKEEGKLSHYRESEFEINKKLKEWYGRKQQIGAQLQQITKDLAIEHTSRAYQKAKQSMQQYLTELHVIENKLERLQRDRERKKELQEYIKDIQEQIDLLQQELHVFTQKGQNLTRQIEELDQAIGILGGEDIRQRISTILQRLDQIPKDREEISLQISRLKAIRELNQREVESKQEELAFLETLWENWKVVFLREDRLSFGVSAVPYSEKDEEALRERAEEILHHSQPICLHYQAREQVKQELDQAFREEHSHLIEYRLSERTVQGMEIPQTALSRLSYQAEYLRKIAGRSLITLDHRGQTLHPHDVKIQLENDLALNQSTLDEKDRQLFQDIILHNIGGVIRHRIERVQKWVERMNDFMVGRNNILPMSIQWIPKTALEEEELDTKELVKLLQKDPLLMKGEDIKRINQHFKSQLERAKERYQSGDYKETLHQTIKSVLDFRNWYSFKLLHTPKEKELELTNAKFGKLSGGQKALAMYLPLFAAVHSRYSEAENGAARLITLDEVFAGVDDANIRDTFGLLEELEFDYLINSQFIWGDYDTVPSLSMYDLLRPKGAGFVTAFRYEWDGHMKRKVDESAEVDDGTITA
jgi:uncharacterized protein (TIGR02680 family)